MEHNTNKQHKIKVCVHNINIKKKTIIHTLKLCIYTSNM